MQIEIREMPEADVLVVLARRLDAAVAEKFKEEAVAQAGRSGRPIHIDLGRVEFVDSSGLGALVGVLKAVGDADRLALVRPARQVRTVLDMTRLSSVFRILDDTTAR